MITAFANRIGRETKSTLAAPSQSEPLCDAGKIVPFIPEARGFRSPHLSDSRLRFAVYPVNDLFQRSGLFRGGKSHLGREPVNAGATTYVDGPEGLPAISRGAKALGPAYFEAGKVVATGVPQSPVRIGDFKGIDRVRFTCSRADSMGVLPKGYCSLPIKKAAKPPSHKCFGFNNHHKYCNRVDVNRE